MTPKPNPVLEIIEESHTQEIRAHNRAPCLSSNRDIRVRTAWGDRPIPTDWPTWDELQSARERLEDHNGCLLHFGIYDIPGSGTKTVPTSNYFNAQGLFALDCIIVVVKDSFQEHESAFSLSCAKLNIPTYIVHSRSDTHMRDVCDDNGDDPEDPEAHLEARNRYIREAKANLHRGPENFHLPIQKVYLVNARSTLRLVKQSNRNPLGLF
ncbi:hypothetical protein DL96DRAFT_1551613 [Flagelloscypha sp. PMI_526]|nr:hypothetical protein DL96DRAFT_1551613 [Flagelloscypha sp. PMI_526]